MKKLIFWALGINSSSSPKINIINDLPPRLSESGSSPKLGLQKSSDGSSPTLGKGRPLAGFGQEMPFAYESTPVVESTPVEGA